MLTAFPIFLVRGISKRCRSEASEWALLWAARTYVRISDNERHGSKAEETNGVKKRECDTRDIQPLSVAFVSTWWTAGNRLVFLNSSWWQISTCEPVALQLTGDNGMKGAGRRLERIHIYIWVFVRLNGLHSSTLVTLFHWPVSSQASVAISRVICFSVHKWWWKKRTSENVKSVQVFEWNWCSHES